MPILKAELSAESLAALIRDVRAYKQTVRAAPKRIIDSLVTHGVAQIEANIHDIQDKDGNDLATAGHTAFGENAAVFLQGEQAAFLEYGTGEGGAASPHPQASAAGWDYASGETIRTTKDGRRMWRYRQKGTGRFRTTFGIPAGRVVLKTAATLRDATARAAKEALQ